MGIFGSNDPPKPASFWDFDDDNFFGYRRTRDAFLGPHRRAVAGGGFNPPRLVNRIHNLEDAAFESAYQQGRGEIDRFAFRNVRPQDTKVMQGIDEQYAQVGVNYRDAVKNTREQERIADQQNSTQALWGFVQSEQKMGNAAMRGYNRTVLGNYATETQQGTALTGLAQAGGYVGSGLLAPYIYSQQIPT